MSRYKTKSLSVYVGEIGETVAKKYLKKRGFKIVSYMFLSDILSPKSPRYCPPEIDSFLGSMKKNFLEMKSALEKGYGGKEHRRGLDFLAEREGKYYVVEVKTNDAQLDKTQKEELLLSKKHGFIPLLVNTKVTLIANSEDVVIQFL
jgi:hypothetical protein